MRPTFVAFAGAALCLALVAGCSGDEQRPSTLPPVSPSPVESVVPSPTPSLTEEQAVEAAVRFYFEGFQRAYAQRDAQELAKGSTDSCPCRSAVQVVADLLSKGEVRGGEVTIEDVRVVEVLPDLATVQVVMVSNDGRVVDEQGQTVTEFRGEGRVTKTLLLNNDSGSWLVTRFVG